MCDSCGMQRQKKINSEKCTTSNLKIEGKFFNEQAICIIQAAKADSAKCTSHNLKHQNNQDARLQGCKAAKLKGKATYNVKKSEGRLLEFRI